MHTCGSSHGRTDTVTARKMRGVSNELGDETLRLPRITLNCVLKDRNSPDVRLAIANPQSLRGRRVCNAYTDKILIFLL